MSLILILISFFNACSVLVAAGDNSDAAISKITADFQRLNSCDASSVDFQTPPTSKRRKRLEYPKNALCSKHHNDIFCCLEDLRKEQFLKQATVFLLKKTDGAPATFQHLGTIQDLLSKNRDLLDEHFSKKKFVFNLSCIRMFNHLHKEGQKKLIPLILNTNDESDALFLKASITTEEQYQTFFPENASMQID